MKIMACAITTLGILLPSVLLSGLISTINGMSDPNISKIMQPVIAQEIASNSTENSKPKAIAGPDQTVKSGDRVYLDGTKSYDPDCKNGNDKLCTTELKYSWEKTRGPKVPELISDIPESKTSFTAPTVHKAAKLTIDLYVEDDIGDYGIDSINITVEPAIEKGQQPHPNQLPVADAGRDNTVRVGQEVHLDGTRSYPKGAIKSIGWTQIGGPNVTLSNADTLEPVFNAPSVEESKKLIFTLVVSGDAGPSKPDSVTVRVEPTTEDGQQPEPSTNQTPPNSGITFNATLSQIKDILPVFKQNDLSVLLPLAGIGVVAIAGTAVYGKYRSKKSQHNAVNVTVVTRGGIE